MRGRVSRTSRPSQDKWVFKSGRSRVSKAGPSKDKLASLLGISEDADSDEAMEAMEEMMDPVIEAVEDYWTEYEDLSDEDQDDLNMEWDVDLYDDSIKLVRAFDPGLADALDRVDKEKMYAYTEYDARRVYDEIEIAIGDLFDGDVDARKSRRPVQRRSASRTGKARRTRKEGDASDIARAIDMFLSTVNNLADEYDIDASEVEVHPEVEDLLDKIEDMVRKGDDGPEVGELIEEAMDINGRDRLAEPEIGEALYTIYEAWERIHFW